MSITHVRTIGVGLCFFIASAASASATTYVVDASGSGQFTDIQPAIDAAQPGDVLLVLNGSYSAFTLSKGLSIIGYGAASVAGAASILAIPADETAVVVNVKPLHLTIGGCMGPVLVQGVRKTESVDVQQSVDVRLRGISMEAPDGPAADACTVGGSRVEIAVCKVFGSNVPACGSSFNGGSGLVLNHSSRVQLALSDAFGGSGAQCYQRFQLGGDGGDAVRLGTGDVLFVAGGGTGYILAGGGGGDEGLHGNCDDDGYPGEAIDNQGGNLWYSGAFIIEAGQYVGQHCVYFPPPLFTGPTLVTPDDPTLDAGDQPTAGGSVQLRLHAPPGATATLYFGRRAIVMPTRDAQIELLTTKSRIVDLGTIPANGLATFTLPLASSLQPGTLLIAQAEVTLSNGRLRRTNSVPVVVR